MAAAPAAPEPSVSTTGTSPGVPSAPVSPASAPSAPLTPGDATADAVGTAALSSSSVATTAGASSGIPASITLPNPAVAKMVHAVASSSPLGPAPSPSPGPSVATAPSLLPPVAPPVVALAADVTAINAIIVNAKSGGGTTQQALSQLIKDVNGMGKGYRVEVEAVIDKSPTGETQLETFTVDSAPGEAFYKAGVTYKIKVMNGNDEVAGLGGTDIKRQIYTTSKTPEGAISAVHHFTETVIELAKATADPAHYKGKFEEFAKQSDKDDIMQQTCFRFNYTKDGAALSSVFASDKGKKEINIYKYDVAAAEKFYYRDLGTQEIKPFKAGEDFRGKAIYGSEEEAYLHTPFMVIDASKYARLVKGDAIEQELAAIKEEIAKKEREMAEIKAKFIEEPTLKLFFSPKETQEFKQYLANLEFDNDPDSVSDDALSPARLELLELENGQKAIKNFQAAKAKAITVQGELKKLNEKLDAYPLADIAADLKSIVKAETYDGLVGSESVKLQQCIALNKKELADFESKEPQIAVELKAITDALPAAKQNVALEKKHFNNLLADLQNRQRGLQRELEKLKEFRQQGELASKTPGTQEAQQKGARVFQSISQKEIDELEAKITANETFIDKIKDQIT